MDYCGPVGVPLTVFLAWTDVDQGAAVAWQARRDRIEADCCGGCGQPRSGWLDENGVELRVAPFEVVDVYCPACAALDRHRRHGRDDEEAKPGVFQAFKRRVLHPGR